MPLAGSGGPHRLVKSSNEVSRLAGGPQPKSEGCDQRQSKRHADHACIQSHFPESRDGRGTEDRQQANRGVRQRGACGGPH